MVDKEGPTAGRRQWRDHPRTIHPPYRSSPGRAPRQPLLPAPHALRDLAGPVYGQDTIGELDADLTRNAAVNGAPLGERIVVTGTVSDCRGRPLAGALVEVWQANAAGRYVHRGEVHDAPLDPNFFGGGRTLTDRHGRYRFVTIKPGAYPWGNHPNAWRPAHIHFSVLGEFFAQRLVTQMFFPGDPLFRFDPIYHSIADAKVRDRLVARFDLERVTVPDWALGYVFDIVLRGAGATPLER